MVFPKWINFFIIVTSILLTAGLFLFQTPSEAFLLLLLPIVATAVCNGFTAGMMAGLIGTAVLLIFASLSQTPWTTLQPLAALFLLVGLLSGWIIYPVALKRAETPPSPSPRLSPETNFSAERKKRPKRPPQQRKSRLPAKTASTPRK